MSWVESLIGGTVTVLASGGFVAVVNRLQRRDVLEDGRAREERREETASHKREDRVLERLHDDCREEVRAASARIDSLAEENASIRVDLARCEERHTAVEERIARLERRSTPPIDMPTEPFA